MSIIGIGTDLLEVDRMQQAMQRHGQRLLLRLFTPAERAEGGNNVAYYAKRFAAKEAIAKAMGTGIGTHVGWQDIEILRTASGQPHAQLRGQAHASMFQKHRQYQCHITLSDTATHALAFCVIA